MDVFEASQDLACFCRSGRVAAINRAGLRLLGLGASEAILGRPFAEFAECLDGRDLAAVLASRSVQGCRLPAQLNFGGRKATVDLQIFHAGEIAADAIVLIGRDCTREQQLVAAARECTERFTILVDNAINLVCHVCNGEIRYVNQAGVAMLHATDDQAVIGRPLAALVHADYADMLVSDMLDIIMADGQPVPMRIRRDDGSLMDALVKFTGLPSQDRSEVMVEMRDITATNRAVLALKGSVETLEQRVQERTAELAHEKDTVEKAIRDLESAHFGISEGIRYASRLQAALLPEPGALEGVVAEVAAGWQPLDLVGGDYYWFERFGGRAVIALFDCTGHGVPGAFMTAVAASALARVLHHHNHDDPAVICTELDRLVRAALRQDREGSGSNDGLDAAICVVDAAAGRLSFVGANLPLLMQSKQGVQVVRGDRMSLGYIETPNEFRFRRHDFQLAAGDTFFLYTDGVIDQVGGPQRRLFGRSRLVQALGDTAGRPLGDQIDAVFARLGVWRGAEPRRDDMTFVAFKPLG